MVRLLRDRRHPDAHDAIVDRLLAQARESAELCEWRRLNVPRVHYPPDLPITARKDEIVAAIRNHPVVVIAGETGSGKTTQIPKMCLEAGLGVEGKIGCTQPRRVAALSISQRIAEELRVSWGREVGCKIRFDDRSGSETFIKLMTDGMLLAETQGDPLLSEYNAIIIDEAHERSLNIDFLLGYLKGLITQRPDLKLVITSATIDTEAFSKAFNNAPIIEVSGRIFPVDVIYSPLDADSEASGDLTYVEGAARAAEQVLFDSSFGDILIFMPTERDIRETSDLIEGRWGREAEVIPLFGRLSSGDQQRVFAPSSRRKIVIATNIAETSLTIPGIRYVIDAGFARISRYNARTRTKRLPIEAVSQSSANQRKGRAGRVQDGTCIRLYSEEDFNERPRYTQPEIQRANLAEVILRMKAFSLGQIETFPFVNPPPPAAIQAGYALLYEIGALDENRELTQLGKDISRLPIDPTLGRMLLQSQLEHAPRELLIIASGLSVQDPRERPLDQKEAADAAHKRFSDPRSDFLTLLNIWNAVHGEWETLRTQGQRRKFCKAHFLSYLRMREWQDLHAQLEEALEGLGSLSLNESNAAYEAIHRSVLSGLLGHIAVRKERNVYVAPGNRQLSIFPGSVLFERQERVRKGVSQKEREEAADRASHQPPWIVAGEIVETSQLFARTLAGIDPEWIFQLAPHLCSITYENPRWNVASGRVIADERAMMQGLEVHRRRVAYGNINAAAATEIFIRSALVEEDLVPPPTPNRRFLDAGARLSQQELMAEAELETANRTLPANYRFIEHNRRVREKIATWQTRVRRHNLPDIDTALAKFYARHLSDCSSLPELNRLLRGQKDPNFLCVSEAELTGGLDLSFREQDFPNIVALGEQPLAVKYAYAPGEDHDGVTLVVPFGQIESITPAAIAWSIPGLREDQAGELLRALPKSLRRQLMPFPPKIVEIVRDFRPTGPSFFEDLARFLHQRFAVEVPPSSWPADALPPHLNPRLEVVGNDRKTVATGRDLHQIRSRLKSVQAPPPGEDPAWKRITQKWERFGLTSWTFGDLPERITVSEVGIPLYAWPGLVAEESGVSLRLFRNPAECQRATRLGVGRLVEIALQKDLAWAQKDLRALASAELLYLPLGSSEELQSTAFENLKGYILPREVPPPLTLAKFQAWVEAGRHRLRGLVPQLIDRISAILELRRQIASRCGPATPAPASSPPRSKTLNDLRLLNIGGPPPPPVRPTHPIAVELESLVPARFLSTISYEQLEHLPRFLKALLVRAERASVNPVKDQERARQVAPYVEALRKLRASSSRSPEVSQGIEEFRWMVEEFKVSIFAQELGTAVPVSSKRLDQLLEKIQKG
jgi:ATP-dependent helicase HrpA